MRQAEYLRNEELAAGMYVPETRFGIWFLRTETWTKHVLERALNDLERLIEDRQPFYSVIVDIGCGRGRSFKLLADRFSPQRMVGIDVDAEMLQIAAVEAASDKLSVEFRQTTSSRLMLPDQSVDMIFCHQTFHHLMDQEA